MQKKPLKTHKVVTMIDFKENLHLNITTKETFCNYDDKPQQSYFNYTIYYKNDDITIQNKFFDCISNNLNKNTW